MNISPQERRRLEYINITMEDINNSSASIYESLVDSDHPQLKSEILYLIKRLRDLLKSTEDEYIDKEGKS
jgi:hypothetical protein